MRRFGTILRRSMNTIVLIGLILFVGLYVASKYNLSGLVAKKTLTGQLADYLGTKVDVNNVEVDIFNQIVLDQIVIHDQNSDTLLSARRAMVSFDLLPLLRRKLQIHTVQLIDFDVNLSKHDSLSDTNFQFLLDVFIPKDKDNKRKVVDDLSINSVILRNGRLRYDDYSNPHRNEFLDINHLRLEEISSNLNIKSSKSEGLIAKLKRLSFKEQSGLIVDKANALVSLDSDGKQLRVDDVILSLEQSLSKDKSFVAQLYGEALMENKQLNVNLSSIEASVNNDLFFNGDIRVQDALSYADEMHFDAMINDFKISSSTIEKVLEKSLEAKKYKDYFANIEVVKLLGEAKGSLDEIIYKTKVETDGKLKSEIDITGNYRKDAPIDADVIAYINNLEFKDYSYDEITVNGHVDNECFKGIVSVLDPLCEVNAEGSYRFVNGNHIDIIADVERFDPNGLKLSKYKNLDSLTFCGKLIADVQYKNKNLPLGHVTIDSLLLKRESESFVIPQIEYFGENKDGEQMSVLKSELLEAEYHEDKISKINGVIKEEKKLSEILRLPFSIDKNAKFRIELDSLRRLQYADIQIPEASYNNYTIKGALSTYGESDSLNHILQVDVREGKNHISSVMYASSRFSPLYIDIKPCQVNFNQDVLNCSGATLAAIEDNVYDIKNLALNYKDQSIVANGIIAKTGNSDFQVHVENLGLDTICSFLKASYLDFGGRGTGDILYTNINSDSHIEFNNFEIKDVSYINCILGDAKISGLYNLDKKLLTLDADIDRENRTTQLQCLLDRGTSDTIDLKINANKLPVDFLDNWLGGFLEEIHGDATGDLHLFGRGKTINVVGRPLADISFTNNLIGSRIYLNDYISSNIEGDLDHGIITFENAKLTDRFGHLATVNAAIHHSHLRHYNYDIRIDLPNDNNGFLIFDKPTHYNNELYWGQLYVTGLCQIKGQENRHRIELSCKTVGKSQFNLSPEEESYSDNGYNFLTFRDKEQFENSEKEYQNASSLLFNNSSNNAENNYYVELDIQAQATENCQVYVQMDPLAEDRLICRGTGDISLHYDPRHDITIGGEYNMTSGSYLITMRGDLMNKEFQIQNGSRVTFPGNFSDADLSINALYSIPSVNLRDLDESFATMASMNRTTLPVDCKLAVTGQMSAPQISFDLEVKNTSDDVQALVHNIIGTQEMLNREVFYLLLFSKFYSPEYATNSQNNTGSQLSSFASASLTSQLNNLLGHVSDNLTLGTNFRSDKGDFTDMEMDLSLSTRLLGDRLILNGNLGYRDPANRVGLNNNATSFIGDFDVEFLINTSGTLRAKAYSHYNERDYSINNALTTQGIGFIVRKDFKSIKELLFWKKISEKK